MLSFKNALKYKTNWQQLSIPKLIKMFQEVDILQYKDLGPFKLAEKFIKFVNIHAMVIKICKKEKDIDVFMSKTFVDKSEEYLQTLHQLHFHLYANVEKSKT